MSHHLSDEQMRKYSEKRLEPAELLRVDDHLSVCENCRNAISVDSDAVAHSFEQEFAELQEQQHLTYDQIVGSLENKSGSDRESVDTHLQICSRCKSEYEDLRAFAVESSRSSKSKFYPWLAVAAVLVLLALVATLTYRRPTEQQTQQQPTRSVPIVLSIQDAGTRITLDQNGTLKGLNAPTEHQDRVRLALQKQQVELPGSLKSLITTRGVVRGDLREGVPFDLLKPVGTFVSSDHPLFQWEALEGASQYRVTILDLNMTIAADSGWLANTTWTPDKPLQRDKTYIWQVAALRSGVEVLSPTPPAGEARFRVLDQHSYNRLDADRQKYSDSLLLLGLLYSGYGLLDDAEDNFQRLAEANPSSQPVKLLFKNLQSARR